MNDLVRDFEAGWTGGLPETPCGWGSTMKATAKQRDWIPNIVDEYGIHSIADIGAGDMNWISKMYLPLHVEYTAYDLYPRKPEIITFDLLKEVPAPVDMIMCLWVLNHFEYDDCLTALGNIKKSGAKYLLMTDRESRREFQPPDIVMPYIEKTHLTDLGDFLLLIDLDAV